MMLPWDYFELLYFRDIVMSYEGAGFHEGISLFWHGGVTMKEQDGLGIDRFRNRYSVPPMTVNVWRPGRFADRARLSLFVSLLLTVVMLAAPIASLAEVSVGMSVTIGPPALPVYVQPPCPDPGFIWTPGYWAWDPGFGYYWVPGAWVPAPFVGVLWTPGYWAWNGGGYLWYEGYWGPVVGYYGGINYGYGYTGYGYAGGYWSGNRFYYNRAVNNVNVTRITTVYRKPVGNVRPAGASFNGPGGATVRPTSEQLTAARQQRSSLTDAQMQHMQAARTDPRQRATVNHGRPAIAATMKPGEFTGRGVTGASRAGAPFNATPDRRAAPGERVRTPGPGAEMHPRGTGPARRMSEPRPAQRRPEMRPQVTAPGRMAPGAPREAPERRMSEPRPSSQRPETTRPLPPKEENKREREETR
jgi:WXXGXW repeat (2 copies)